MKKAPKELDEIADKILSYDPKKKKGITEQKTLPTKPSKTPAIGPTQ